MSRIAVVLSASGRSSLSKDSPEKGCALRAGGGCQRSAFTLKAPSENDSSCFREKLSGVNLTGVRPRFDVPALYAPTSLQSKIWFYWTHSVHLYFTLMRYHETVTLVVVRPALGR